MLDLHLYPLHIKEGSEQPFLPGLHFVLAPRFAVRARQGDILVMLLSSNGEQFIPAERITQILDSASKAYFRGSGTITAGLRACVDEINQAVLDYNLHDSIGNQQQSCMLNVAVLHEERVYIGHCGYTHTFVLSKNGTEHLFDPESSGRGLGLSRTTTVRFFLSDLHENDYLLFSPEPLSTWTPANLNGSPSIAFDYLRRRLLNQVSPNIRALLIQAVAGSGKTILEASLSSNNGFFTPPSKPVAPSIPATQKMPNGHEIPRMAIPTASRKEPAISPQITPEPSLMSGMQKQVKPLPVSEPVSEEEPTFKEIVQGYKQEAAEKITSVKELFTRTKKRFSSQESSQSMPFVTKPKVKLPVINIEPLLVRLKILKKGASHAAAVTGSTLQFAGDKVGGMLGDAVDYVTPEGGFKTPALSTKMMLLISLFVPIILVSTASTIYLQKGRSSQYEMYFNQAKAVADTAASYKTPHDIRSAWNETITLLDKAEKYGKDERSETLRQQALNTLDDLAGIARVDFQPALVENLPSNVKVVKMKSTSTDLYMLDEVEGRILRALLTGRGFELDTSFACNPGPYGSYTVDPLVDFALMPKGNTIGAGIAALDDRGNIVYCGSGMTATSMTLIPPQTGWGKIKGIAIDSGKLFVLDTTANAIWVYYGVSGTYTTEPNLYFDNDIPKLDDVLDFSISGNDLVLLHQDGHVTTCVFSEISGTPTKCKDPAPFVIDRPGIENKPVIIPDTNFTQISYTTPPDPSIFLLDTNSVSIYHLSLKLSLQRQLSIPAKDVYGLSNKKPTAFTINPAKLVFIAFGNKVYSGMQP